MIREQGKAYRLPRTDRTDGYPSTPSEAHRNRLYFAAGASNCIAGEMLTIDGGATFANPGEWADSGSEVGGRARHIASRP